MNINVELKNVDYKNAKTEEIEITEDGEYLPSEGIDGFSKVLVSVLNDIIQPNMEDDEIDNIFNRIISDNEQIEPSMNALQIINEIWR